MAVDDKRSPLLGALEGLGREITIGIHADEGAEDHGGLTNAELGTIHELGLGVPQRSFVRAYFDENVHEIGGDVEAAIARVLEGSDVDLEAELLGAKIEAGMKERILARIEPGLSEETKRKRGQDAVPLVDTSQLMGSIRYKVNPAK